MKGNTGASLGGSMVCVKKRKAEPCDCEVCTHGQNKYGKFWFCPDFGNIVPKQMCNNYEFSSTKAKARNKNVPKGKQKAKNKYGEKPYSKNKEIFCRDTNEHCTGETYLKSKHWQQMRKIVYEKYKGKCQRCGDCIPLGMANVHHRTYKRIGNENINDLILYCNKCHAIMHKDKALEKNRKKDLNSFINQLDRSERAEAFDILKNHFHYEQPTGDKSKRIPICDKNEPTIKQVNFASNIAKAMKIEMPKEYTKKAYGKFIEDNISAFKEITR